MPTHLPPALRLVAATTFMVAAMLTTTTSVSAEPVQWRIVNGGNDHWYETVLAPAIHWDDARIAAQARAWHGMPGYLATLTSPEENTFVWSAFAPEEYWLGGFQQEGAPEPAGGWAWITGEPWLFENWGPGEPNNGGSLGNESALHFKGGHGQWNDSAPNNIEPPGYVVEYGDGSSGDPVQWRIADGGNDHWYETVLAPAIHWDAARTAAQARVWHGLPGHLATLTSVEENAFVWSVFAPEEYWLGGFQQEGAPEPAGGWAWLTGEPWLFENWGPGEPNNGGSLGNENALHFKGGHGQWNDSAPNNIEPPGYVVEYEDEAVAVDGSTWGRIKARVWR